MKNKNKRLKNQMQLCLAHTHIVPTFKWRVLSIHTLTSILMRLVDLVCFLCTHLLDDVSLMYFAPYKKQAEQSNWLSGCQSGSVSPASKIFLYLYSSFKRNDLICMFYWSRLIKFCSLWLCLFVKRKKLSVCECVCVALRTTLTGA